MTGKVRINITFDPETLRLADREARRRRISRSALIRDAIRAVASDHERESEEAARRRRQRAAVEGMRQLARKVGKWPAVELLHAWRYRLERSSK